MSALTIRMGAAQALPLDYLLSQIPSLPRHVLDRLVERAIDRLDEMDGDPDLEDSESGNHLVDDRGRWCGGGDIALVSGPWHEDDEDTHDRELTDEREIEDYAGGHPNEYGDYSRTHITA